MAGNILTGLKFKTNFFSVDFYQEETLKQSVLLGKTPFDMLLFTVFDNGTANTPAADLTSFREIMSKSVAFLALDTFLALDSLRSFLTSSVLVYGNKGICLC